ncbi:hypothetical protein HDU81_000592 [Chytriomyces hyalinus]|nr:hypothetical protein HDU81_000592 [Chytriomyces hyalinus]
MHAAATTRDLPPQRQRVRRPRIVAKPCILKGDAEVPSDKELVLLEIEARRKVHSDRERLQPLHDRLLADMREQLDRELLTPGTIDPFTSDVGVLRASASPEQVAEIQDMLPDVWLHETAAIDILDPIWFPHLWYSPMNPFASAADLSDTHPHPLLQTQSNQGLGPTSHEFNGMNATGLISVGGVTHGMDAVSFTNFEELFNAFPMPPLA